MSFGPGQRQSLFFFVHFWMHLVDVCWPMALEYCSQNPLLSFYFHSLWRQVFWAIRISLHRIVSL